MTASSSSSSSSCLSTFVSEAEFNLFHKIDRKLYSILAINLLRDPMDAMKTMALWLWLERVGFRHIIYRMLAWPIFLINELADEAAVCIAVITSDNPPSPSDANHIALTQSFMIKEISLKILHDNRKSAVEGVTKILNEICFRAFKDIFQRAVTHRTIPPASSSAAVIHPPPSVQAPVSPLHVAAAAAAAGGSFPNNVVVQTVAPEDRAMFVTFSKGYPVQEWEVREFFTGKFGDCIELFQMQEVEPNEQALFARIVFRLASTIDLILNGQQRIKFAINGKHVWARKFIPKRLPSPVSMPMPPQIVQAPPFFIRGSLGR